MSLTHSEPLHPLIEQASPATGIAIQNKTPFESESDPSGKVSTHVEVSKTATQIERERRPEGRIELKRRKAAFAFRLTAVHSPRIAASGDGKHGTRTSNRSGSNYEASEQFSQH